MAADLLTNAELPKHERGASAAPSQGALVARGERLSDELHRLMGELPGLDEGERIGVARGLDRVAEALKQTAAAAGLGRRSAAPPAPVRFVVAGER